MKHLSLFALLICLLASSCTPSEEDLLAKSRSLMDAGQFSEATDYLSRTLEHYPENTTALNMRGVAYVEQENYDAALADFSKAITLDSTAYRPYYNRANVYNETRRYPEALEDYNKVITLAPEQADAYVNRAAVLYEMEQYQNAKLDLEVAQKKNPQSPQIHLNLGKTLIKLNETEEAKKELQVVLALDNKQADAFYLLGLLAQNEGNTEEACTYYAQAEKLGNEVAHRIAEELCGEGHKH